MPAFNGHALRGYEDMVTGLDQGRGGPLARGEPFESLQRMNALTLEVILQVVFGVTDETRLAELRPLVNKTVNIPPLIFLGWGFPRLQKYGPWRRTIENQVELDRVIFAEIARAPPGHRPGRPVRRTLPAAAGARRRRRRRIRGHSATRSCATSSSRSCSPATRPPRRHWPGRCTSSARIPQQEAKARDAASAGDTDYLEAVLKESMRLHPVIPMVVRH